MKSKFDEKTWEKLKDLALDTRQSAYAPYSEFLVGASIMAEDDRLFTGCNVENASYGLAFCAERNALTTAVAAGKTRFKALVVATDVSPPGPPCGLCLQMLAEFCVDIEIGLVNPSGEFHLTSLAELMPNPFRWKGAGTPFAEDSE